MREPGFGRVWPRRTENYEQDTTGSADPATSPALVCESLATLSEKEGTRLGTFESAPVPRSPRSPV